MSEPRVWWRKRYPWVTAQMQDGDKCPVCILRSLHWHRLLPDGTIAAVLVMDAELEQGNGPSVTG